MTHDETTQMTETLKSNQLPFTVDFPTILGEYLESIGPGGGYALVIAMIKLNDIARIAIRQENTEILQQLRELGIVEEAEEPNKSESARQEQVRIVGTVQRIEEAMYDYGDVTDGNWNSRLMSPLLCFEGQCVEITIRVLERSRCS